LASFVTSFTITVFASLFPSYKSTAHNVSMKQRLHIT
jgi:hypothetical protein